MKKRYIVMLCSICILFVAAILVTCSYAYWSVTVSQVDNNTLASACLNVDIVSDGGVTIDNMIPIDRDDLRSSNSELKIAEHYDKYTPYVFTLKNTCDTSVLTTFSMDVLESTTMPIYAVGATLFKGTPESTINGTSIGTGIYSTALLTDPLYRPEPDENGVLANIEIYNRYYIPGNTEETFSLYYIFINYDGVDTMSKTFESKLKVEADPIADLNYMNNILLDDDNMKDNISTVTFLDSINIPENAEYIKDVSFMENENIKSYLVKSDVVNKTTNEQMYDMYIASNDPIYIIDASGLFEDYTYTTAINNLNLLNTQYTRDMGWMFRGMESITSIDLSSFKTSNVTNMRSMFYEAESLTSLDLSSFNTSNVTDMSWMFTRNEELQSLNVSNFDTSKVTDMQCMFYSCEKLLSLDVSSFRTTNLISLHSAFAKCYSISELDVSNWDTSNVTIFVDTFLDCYNLTSLDVSKWDTSSAISMGEMFGDCYSLTYLNLDNFNTSNVTDISTMFNNCVQLKTLNLSNFDTSKVTDMSSIFENCVSLSEIDLSNWDFSKVNEYYEMFMGLGVEEFTTTIKLSNSFDITKDVKPYDFSKDAFDSIGTGVTVYVKTEKQQTDIINLGGSTNLTTANVIIQ